MFERFLCEQRRSPDAIRELPSQPPRIASRLRFCVRCFAGRRITAPLGALVMTLVGLHIAAALFESYRLRENLPLSMVTGKRRKFQEH